MLFESCEYQSSLSIPELLKCSSDHLNLSINILKVHSVRLNDTTGNDRLKEITPPNEVGGGRAGRLV